MSNKITFANLVARIAEETGAPKQHIHDLLKEAVDVIEEGLLRDGRVHISGLGIFKLKWTEVRGGINPQTGESIEIPAQNRVYFKPDAQLRRFINRKYEHLEPELIEEEPSPTPVPGVYTPGPPIRETGIPSGPAQTEKEPTEAPKPSEAAEAQPLAGKEEPSFWKKNRWIILIVAVLLLIILISIPFFRSDGPPEPTATELTQPEDQPSPNVPDKTIGEEQTTETKTQTPSEPESVGTPGGVHMIERGDKLWTIAQSFYKSAYLWPNIYRVNLDEVDSPDRLPVGADLQVPDLEGRFGELTSTDIRQIMDGYVLVYLAYRERTDKDAQYYLWVATQYEMPEILNKYSDEIKEAEIAAVKKIKGNVQIR